MCYQTLFHGKWIRRIVFLAIGIGAASGFSLARPALSEHTTIPVVFVHTLNSSKLKRGDSFELKTTQAVSLNGGERIPKGSLVVGHILKANPQQGGTAGSVLEFEFQEIHNRGRVIPVNLYLRALANFVQAHDATLPNTPPDSDTSSSTTQVGGDEVYPGDKVYSYNGAEVGKANRDGVFAYLKSSGSGSFCDASDDLQPVGIFSASACGLYGLSHLTLDQSDASGPSVVIRLSSDKNSVKIPWGSEALLEVAPGVM
jgi:hypothetical protein